jgi:putative sigma-54 modulation protein
MTLEVEIYTRNMELTDRIKEYVEKKVGKLDRYLSGIDQARVDLAFAKSARSASDRQVAQITVRGKGIILRAEERADDIFAAIDNSLEKLQRQMERYKGKRQPSKGDGRGTGEIMQEAEFVEEEPEESKQIVVRRKKFIITPMDESEAIEQMQLLGHEDFFVFYNVSTNAINILYQRKDGGFGLIEPEIA